MKSLTYLFFIIMLQGFSNENDFNKIPKSENALNFFFLNEKIGWKIDKGFSYSNLYRTIDGGKRWELQITWPPAIEGEKSQYPSVYKVGWGEYLYDIYFFDEKNGIVSSSKGILKTKDGGKTWKKKETENEVFNIFFVNNKKGWACNYKYIMESNDGGANWEVDSGFTNICSRYFIKSLYSIFFLDSIYGWIGGDGALCRTKDGGKTWECDTVYYDKASSLDFNYGFIENIYFKDSIRGYVITKSNLYLTEDGGKSLVEIKFEDYMENIDILFINDKDGFACGCSELEYDEMGFPIYKGGNVYITKDGGLKWDRILKIEGGLRKIQYLKDENILLIGGEGGIYKYRIKK